MKTKKTTRVSFSDNVINITLPTSWMDVTQPELARIYRLMSRVTLASEQLPYYIFRTLTGAKIERKSEDKFLMYFRINGKRVNKWVTPEEISELIAPLDFVYNPGAEPVRLDELHKFKAVDAQFHGVKFSDYIMIENYYQGFLVTRDNAILTEIAKILYPGLDVLHADECVNVLNWLVQVKEMFSKMFVNFFRPVTTGNYEAPIMADIMNNEIRALTGGDVTKEQEIFDTDCWRALTELDYKAKEADELKKAMNKK